MDTVRVAGKVVGLDAQGNVVVEGQTLTPAEIGAGISWVDKAWREVSNKANWNVKQVEKIIVYGAAAAAATNGFGQIAMPSNVRGWIVGASALVLGAIHFSTPKAN